jgi:hypothetical protein
LYSKPMKEIYGLKLAEKQAIVLLQPFIQPLTLFNTSSPGLRISSYTLNLAYEEDLPF